VALNASIEAARVGAGGREFAPVAEALRALAAEGAQAARAASARAVGVREEVELASALVQAASREVQAARGQG
jgi:methyl-accepting chemotaxis protein